MAKTAIVSGRRAAAESPGATPSASGRFDSTTGDFPGRTARVARADLDLAAGADPGLEGRLPGGRGPVQHRAVAEPEG